mmetsp:Transcript_24397/g.49421  ORF Transcript_24397/g.49421 Transcript_24397/m.49421 type:complete len:215 (+) Transcript_24397:108-752(+)
MLCGQVLGSELGPDEWHMCPILITVRCPPLVVLPKPHFLKVLLEVRLQYRVPGNLRHIRHGKVEGGPSNAVLLKQGIVRHVEQQGVVSGKGDIQPPLEEFWKWVVGNLAEEKVVREGAYGQPHLVEIVQVLEGHLAVQVYPVVDGLGKHVGSSEVHHVTRLACMGAECDDVQSPGSPQFVQYFQIGPQKVKLPTVCWVFLRDVFCWSDTAAWGL